MVTVIIVNWNSGDLLLRCLDALDQQSRKPEQICILDNASSDDSWRAALGRSGVSLIHSDTNLGFAAGNNLLLRQCKTKFVALLNPDAFPESRWLESLLHAAEIYPEVDAFGSRQMLDSSPDGIDGLGDVYHVSGLVWRSCHGKLLTQADLGIQEVFTACAGAALYRRETIMAIGGFDEDFFCYMEDVDLGFRLRLAGSRCLEVPDAVVQHVGSACSGGQHSDFAVYHGHRNLVWTFFKNMPAVLLWVLLPVHLGLNLLSLLVFSMRGQGGVIFRAKKDALKGLPAVWRKRKLVQAARSVSARAIWGMLDKRIWPRP